MESPTLVLPVPDAPTAARADTATELPTAPSPDRVARRWPGRAALAVAVGAVAALTAAELLAIGGLSVAGWAVGWLTVALAVLAVVGGTVAAIVDWGRAPGVGAIVLGLAANPLLLVVLFDLLGGVG